MSDPQPIEELDALSASAFVDAVGHLFEGAPGFLGRLAIDRPYGSWWNLLTRARVIAQAMPEAEQIELLNAHPRLGAPPEAVSEISYREQGYDREPRESPAADASARPTWGSAASAGAAPSRVAPSGAAELDPVGTAEGDTTRAKLARLNDAYEDWFGFRYCVFVAGRSLETLIPELEAALVRPRDQELHRGIDAVMDIAAARSGAAR